MLFFLSFLLLFRNILIYKVNKENSKKEEILTNLCKIINQKNEKAIQIITKIILGIELTEIEKILEQKRKEQIPEIKIKPKKKYKITPKKEKELIKNYGKKNIEKLAKKMKYEGTIINNPKTKIHAK